MNETNSINPIVRLILWCSDAIIRFIIFLVVISATNHFLALFGLNFLGSKTVTVHDCPPAVQSKPSINSSVSSFSPAPKL